jgi:hypothetical protein
MKGSPVRVRASALSKARSSRVFSAGRAARRSVDGPRGNRNVQRAQPPLPRPDHAVARAPGWAGAGPAFDTLATRRPAGRGRELSRARGHRTLRLLRLRGQRPGRGGTAGVGRTRLRLAAPTSAQAIERLRASPVGGRTKERDRTNAGSLSKTKRAAQCNRGKGSWRTHSRNRTRAETASFATSLVA